MNKEDFNKQCNELHKATYEGYISQKKYKRSQIYWGMFFASLMLHGAVNNIPLWGSAFHVLMVSLCIVEYHFSDKRMKWWLDRHEKDIEFQDETIQLINKLDKEVGNVNPD